MGVGFLTGMRLPFRVEKPLALDSIDVPTTAQSYLGSLSCIFENVNIWAREIDGSVVKGTCYSWRKQVVYNYL